MSDMDHVFRIFVEKRPGFDVEAVHLLTEFRSVGRVQHLQALRIFKRYDVQGITQDEYNLARGRIFSEPNLDVCYDENLPPMEGWMLTVAPLPGQYDQRADSCAQCLQLLTQKERPQVLTAVTYVLEGDLTPEEKQVVEKHLINPVESQKITQDKPSSLERILPAPMPTQVLKGFTSRTKEEIANMVSEMGLAMTVSDLLFCQDYFKFNEKRDPTMTELRVIDTYWSDHCRHTTFQTALDDITIQEGIFTRPIARAYEDYLRIRGELYQDEREINLMDLAVIGMKELKKQGKLADLDQSEEINACSIVVDADIDGQSVPYLILFKNETHNHPTEIEPFGGAATCLGGAIRDPLSGRGYVYQAMRITGCGDVRTPIEETLPGRLPQRKIARTAAAGYSSYGNQIGLCTGKVQEYYHPFFVAKHFELGAVVGAVPRAHVRREEPAKGDIVVLVGGRTGRDGCGGATGSSKAHTEDSLESCGAEVQKGNPPTERSIQRLFRDKEFSLLIKRCNDFGAGGVAVAIGELAPGLIIDLSKVPKKYEGLDGTELAISESQERMACVIEEKDVDLFIEKARMQNLEATVVATITNDRRLRMMLSGTEIVSLSRDFLDTHGVTQHTNATIVTPDEENPFFTRAPGSIHGAQSLEEMWMKNLADLSVCAQRGLCERFDDTIGAGNVLSAFGGKYRATPNEAMVGKIPTQGETTTCTFMSHGYHPELSIWSPFHGGLYAVVEAISKIAAAGGDASKCRLTLQEYFERMLEDPKIWGKPTAALLGALSAQMALGVPAIGGKDSMSGSFGELSVPPTLVAFAVVAGKTQRVISPELKGAGHRVAVLPVTRDVSHMPDFTRLQEGYKALYTLIGEGKVISAHTVGQGGVAAALSKMSFGNKIGVMFDAGWDAGRLFLPEIGAIVVEFSDDAPVDETFFVQLGMTTSLKKIEVNGCSISIDDAYQAWHAPLETIYPTQEETQRTAPERFYTERMTTRPAVKTLRPRVLIPTFPGTNCEDDTARAFTYAGADAKKLIVRNLTPSDLEESLDALVKEIEKANIIALPGGFSAGDEPDGSAKFIATTLRNPRVADAIMDLLLKRDGLMLGICNGFQALIKLGLVPYGEIRPLSEDDPTLTYNAIGRHVALTADTVISSTLSPWMMHCRAGDVHNMPISHGEGRFVISPVQAQILLEKGQIATQYADDLGRPAAELPYCPNGSFWGVEGITSPDGRVFGKMGHSERFGERVGINIPGQKDQGIFRAGVDYFR